MLGRAVVREQGAFLQRRAAKHGELFTAHQLQKRFIMPNIGRMLPPEQPIEEFHNNYFNRWHPDNRPETFNILDAHVAPSGVPIDNAPNLQEWRASLEKRGKKDPFWYLSPAERNDYVDNTRNVSPFAGLGNNCRYNSEISAFYGRTGGDTTSKGGRFLLAISHYTDPKLWAWIPYIMYNNNVAVFGRWGFLVPFALFLGICQQYYICIDLREGRAEEKDFYFSRVSKDFKKGLNWEQKICGHRE